MGLIAGIAAAIETSSNDGVAGGGGSLPGLITEWTVNDGDTITLQGQTGAGATYLFDVDWGDSSSDSGLTTSTETHTYVSGGTYTVKITGQFAGFRMGDASATDKASLTNFVQWGTETTIQGFYNMFSGCANMEYSATDNPTILIDSSVNNNNLFRYVFYQCSTITSLDLSGWNIGNSNLIASSISAFNGMDNCEYLNISGLNLTNSIDWAYGFKNLGQLTTNGCDFIWNDDTTPTNNLQYTWQNVKLKSFTSTNLTLTGTSINMLYIFYNADMLGTSLDLSGWSGTSGIISLIYAFRNYSVGLTPSSINLTGWDTSNVTNFYGLFYSSSGISELIGLSGLSGNGITATNGLQNAFYNCFNLTFDNHNMKSDFCTNGNITTLSAMFQGVSRDTASGSVPPDLSAWDTSNVTLWNSCFNDFQFVSGTTFVMPDLSSATSLNSMFYLGEGVTDLDFSSSNFPSTITDLTNMVRNSEVQTIDFSNCDFSGVTTLSHFGYCCPINSITFDALVSFASLNYGANFLSSACGGQGMTTAEYDAFLIRLDTTGLTGAYSISFTPSQYTLGGGGETARANLVAKGWTISDSGSTPFVNTYSMVFDGIDDVVLCQSDLAGDLNQIDGAITVSCWVKTTQGAVYENMVTRDAFGGTDRDWSLIKDNYYPTAASGGAPLWQLWNTNSDVLQARLTSANDPAGNPIIPINDGNWHYIVGVYDGSDTASLYTDGVLQGTTTVVGFGSFPLRKTRRVCIGGQNNGSLPTALVGSWEGGIDEVAICNTALSDADILSKFNSGIPTGLSSVSPMGWWRMGENGTWDGLKWIFINQGSSTTSNAESANMTESDRVADVPT